MLTREPYLPTRKVVQELLRKYDELKPFTIDDYHWMVNVLHALNDDPDYQKSQDELENSPDVVTAPHEEKPSINIAPPEESNEQTEKAS